MKKLILSVVIACFFTAALAQNCNTIYVSPTGMSAQGTKNDPTSLITAIGIFNSDNTRNYIVLQEGVYSIMETVNLPSNVSIDGGYSVVSGDWIKSSSAITTLNIDPTVSVDNVNGIDVGSYVGFALQNISNVNIKDLDIVVLSAGSTSQTNNRGESIYGVHINNVGSYSFNRVNVSTGNASNGVNGLTGAAGSNGDDDGTDGVTGQNNGNPNGASASSGAGGSGSGPDGAAGGIEVVGFSALPSSLGYRAGGSGGGGGSGGWSIIDPLFPNASSLDKSGFPGGSGGTNGSGLKSGFTGGTGGAVNSSGENGEDGNSGADGTEIEGGLDYPVGNRPSDFVYDNYFIPGAQAASGGDGEGGAGGSGGGGGGPDGSSASPFWPNLNCGTGSGGGGGGHGGQGGQGGQGGFGGGSTFGIYAVGSNSGNANDVDFNIGNFGFGGAGGSGGAGGIGSLGKNGGADLSDVGAGGTGGNGGDGAQGGRGQDGANGVAEDLYGISVDNSSIFSNDISANYYEGCTNSRIDITKTGGAWNLTGSDAQFVNNVSPFATSFDSQSAAAEIYFSSIGNKDVAIESENFKEFINIRYSRNLPTLDGDESGCKNSGGCHRGFSRGDLRVNSYGVSNFRPNCVTATRIYQKSFCASACTPHQKK